MPLTPQGQANVQSTVQSILNDGIPGLVFVAIDRHGNYLTETHVGSTSLDAATAKPMSADSVFWLASCTKLITGIAAMQLVEQGRLSLDSSADLYRILPELQNKQVLVAPGKYEPKQREITLQMLLNHTAGFGYSFHNKKLATDGRPVGYDEFSGDESDITSQPLVNQPGSCFEYGISVDWVGIAVMRVTGLTLQQYFSRHIFQPLALQNVSFIPTPHMKENLVTVTAPLPDGRKADIDHPFRRPIALTETPQAAHLFHSGGAGCFAKPREFVQILATLLNHGASPATGKRILRAETVDKMFANTIPELPDFGRQGVHAAKTFWSTGIPDFYPQGQEPQGWGTTFMLTLKEGPSGRAPGTAHWSGIVNLHWWCDRTTGVAGMIAGQTLPFPDVPIFGGWIKAEKAVYDGLASSQL